MIIALDCDGVIFDANTWVRQLAQNVLNRPLPPAGDHKHFEFDKALGLTADEWRRVEHEVMYSRPTRDMALYPGAIGFVDALLSRGHDVFFLTSHWRGHRFWVPDREARLQLFWPKCDVVFAHNKSRCHFDVLLDDKVENTRNAPRGTAVLFKQPWNAHATVRDYDDTVSSYEEFLQLVDEES